MQRWRLSWSEKPYLCEDLARIVAIVQVEVARAVAALDLELALFPGGPAGRARDMLRELVEGRALLHLDPLTAEMLEAFGWGPVGEPAQ